MLGEEDGEEEAGGAGADDDDLFVVRSACLESRWFVVVYLLEGGLEAIVFSFHLGGMGGSCVGKRGWNVSSMKKEMRNGRDMSSMTVS